MQKFTIQSEEKLMSSHSDMSEKKPHALCIPYAIQGHINPMMKLACLLHHKGFHITFVHSEANYNRLFGSRGSADLPDFKFVAIPDGLPPLEEGTKPSTEDNIRSLCFSIHEKWSSALKCLIAKLNHPPVTCIVADTAMTFGVDVADEIGVPGVLIHTASACSDLLYRHVPKLLEKGLLPLNGEECLTNGYLETPINWIPGMIPLRLKDFPNFVLTTDENDPFLNLFLTQLDKSSKASAIIINTFNDLEKDVLNAAAALSSTPQYDIGPLHLMFNRLIPDNKKFKWMTTSCSLFNQDDSCLQWLDSKPANSVIYVNFGSTAEMSPHQLSELVLGLSDSKKNFLLIIRPELVKGENSTLGPDFWNKVAISEAGHVSGWCPQEEVLAHPSVGGILTHCGWNSMSESICNGLPMLCWPFFADQHINCTYACHKWGIGMQIDRDVKRDQVESLVRELLDGEKGKMMKNKAMEWKEKAAQAVAFGGSSYHNLDQLINKVLLQV